MEKTHTRNSTFLTFYHTTVYNHYYYKCGAIKTVITTNVIIIKNTRNLTLNKNKGKARVATTLGSASYINLSDDYRPIGLTRETGNCDSIASYN